MFIKKIFKWSVWKCPNIETWAPPTKTGQLILSKREINSEWQTVQQQQQKTVLLLILASSRIKELNRKTFQRYSLLTGTDYIFGIIQLHVKINVILWMTSKAFSFSDTSIKSLYLFCQYQTTYMFAYKSSNLKWSHNTLQSQAYLSAKMWPAISLPVIPVQENHTFTTLFQRSNILKCACWCSFSTYKNQAAIMGWSIM